MKTTFRRLSIIIFIFIFTVMCFLITFLLLFKNNLAIYLFFMNFDLLIQKNIYNVSISIYTFFLTIIFTLIGFSINKISKYKLEIRDFIDYLKNFGILFVVYVSFLIYNIICHFFEFIFPHNLISFILLISGILLFLSLSIFTIDTFQSENLFDFISKRTQKLIKKKSKEDKKYKKEMKGFQKYLKQKGINQNLNKLDEKFEKEFEMKFEIIFGNLMASLKEEDFLVTKKILEEIPIMVKKYLEETKRFEMKFDEKFSQKLNDNYNFIFDSLQKSYNEKLYEDFIYSISKTSFAFLEQKKLIGYQTGSSIYFLASMKDFFLRVFKLKRTSANHLIIKKISEHILYYDKNYPNQYNPFRHYLSDIEKYLEILIDIEYRKKETDLNETYGYWSTSLYRNIVKTNRDRFLLYLVNLEKFKYVNQRDYNLQNELDDFSKSFVSIKKITKFNEILTPTIFGLDSFLKDIVFYSGLFKSEIQQMNFYLAIDKYLDFNKRIIFNSFEKNDFQYYNFYPEFIFSIIYAFNLKKEDKNKLILKLTEIILENITLIINKQKKEDRYEDLSLSEIKGDLVDLLAIIIFNSKNYNDTLKSIIEKLSIFYNSLDGKENFFPIFKLIGCWINNFSKLEKEVIIKFNEMIKKDLKELSIERDDILIKLIQPVFEQYGYYNNSFTTHERGYWLYPSNLWSNQFQEDISDFFSSDLSIYEAYHKKLKYR